MDSQIWNREVRDVNIEFRPCGDYILKSLNEVLINEFFDYPRWPQDIITHTVNYNP